RLKEPTGSKYPNLLTVHAEDSGDLEISSDSAAGIENGEFLVKSFLSSLIERGRIAGRNRYSVNFDGEMAVYEHEGLEKTPLYEVTGVDGLYNANGKKLMLMETDLRMEINNITTR